jgi:hypothetical protein
MAKVIPYSKAFFLQSKTIYLGLNYLLDVVSGPHMRIPGALAWTSWTAISIIEIGAGRVCGVMRPFTDLAAGYLAVNAHLDRLSEIGVIEACHCLVFSVAAVLLNLLSVLLPVFQVSLGHIQFTAGTYKRIL